MILSHLRGLACLLLALLTIDSSVSAQSLSLNPNSFYPDSSIIHTGVPVKWTGSLGWQLNTGAAYSLTYTFGDGSSGYVVSRMTGSNPYGRDTFRAVHSYATAGTYTAKVVLKNALGVAIDSLARPFLAGSGYAVSGKFYYDCIENCQPDTPELGVPWAFMGIKINQAERMYWTDSLGFYSAAVAIGDTVSKGTIVADVSNTNMSYCPFAPVVSTNRAVNIAIRLNDRMYMDNFSVPEFLCKGAGFYASVNTHALGGGMPRTRYSFGDGWVTNYVYATDGNNYHSYGYSSLGDFTVSVDLYNTNFEGPYMRYQRQVHVDSCRKLILEPFHDANKTCTFDAAERILNVSYLDLHSKKVGQQSAYLVGSQLEYLLLPGDTVAVDSLAYVSAPGLWAYVKTRKNCLMDKLHAGTPDTATIPFANHLKLNLQYPPNFSYCYADTIRLELSGELIGYPVGSNFEIVSFYGDGTTDTTTLSFSQDTLFTREVFHRYDTSGLKNCVFVLRSAGGDIDTVRVQLKIDDCFPVYVRAFYDLNKNCVKDAGESFAGDFKVTVGSGGTYQSDPATGLVSFYQWVPADSVASIDDASYSAPGYYTRAATNKAACSWPAVNAAAVLQLLPLIDTPAFTCNYFPNPGPACSDSFGATIEIRKVTENYGHTYSLVYYYGDGLHSDTFGVPNVQYLTSHNIAARSYFRGTFFPAYQIFDDSTHALLKRVSLPPFTIWDTCAGKGRLFADIDADCAFTAADAPIAGQVVSILSGAASTLLFTDSSGRFFTKLGTASDSVRIPDTVASRLVPSCGTGLTTELNTGVTVLLPYTCASGYDLRIQAAHYYFRDSTADTLILYPGGYSCHDDPGTLSLTLSAGVSFTGSDFPVTSVSGSSVLWQIDTLSKLPRMIRVGLRVALPAVAQTLCLNASLQGSLPDADPANNDFYLCDSVRAAIPDYYKSLSSDSMTADGALVDGKELIYSLRIRNGSSTDTVWSIILFDTLDARLNPASLHIFDATFPYTANVLPGGVLQIASNGMSAMLPGAEESIRFGIKRHDSLTTGTIIRNRISVVLSGVPEGESNEVSAMAARPAPVKVQSVSADVDVKVFPVPASGAFYIFVADAEQPGEYQVLDARGALCAAGRLNGQRTHVSAAGLAPGIYLVRIVTGNGAYLRKMVLVDGSK